jgi:hypothetical protein
MKKPFLLALLCVGLLISANYLFFSTYSNEIFLDDYIVVKTKFDAAIAKKNLDYILLGDSPALSGFFPDQRQNPTYNFAISCPSNFELYELMKKFDFKSNKVKKIFISTHFLSLTDQEHCFEHLILNYNIISLPGFIEASNSPGFLNYASYQSKLSFFFNFFLLKIYLHPGQFALINSKNLIHDPQAGREKVNELFKATGYINEQSTDEFPYEKPPGEFKSALKTHPFQDFYMKKLLTFLGEQKVDVVFYHPLYFEGYKKLFSDAFVVSVNNYYNQLSKEFPHFKYNSEIQYKGKEYFNDAVHPNRKGAEFFSRWIYEQEGLNVTR